MIGIQSQFHDLLVAIVDVILIPTNQYYFQEGNRNAGTSYIRTVDTLTNLKEEVTESNAMSFSKGKTKLPNIGKGSAEKMLEFVTTGTFAKLEEKRALYA